MTTEQNLWAHLPVLYREVTGAMSFAGKKARLIDGTLGNGGHSKYLLEANPELEILGIDRDEAALERAAKTLAFAGNRVRLRHGNFSSLAEIARDAGWESVDGILLDIGVSSPQLDDGTRGFSWRLPGPLDMRMDRKSPLTASRILNHYGEEELTRIFREYGEINKAKILARMVLKFREERPFETTQDLVELADAALGRSKPGKLPAPTLVFQALRIAVNDELGELENALKAAFDFLSPGGRLAVISFHSLEDRMVKHFFRELTRGCICPLEFPVCICGHEPEAELLTTKALTAHEDELTENRRSSCAKLRICRKCGQEGSEKK